MCGLNGIVSPPSVSKYLIPTKIPCIRYNDILNLNTTPMIFVVRNTITRRKIRYLIISAYTTAACFREI